MTQAPPPPPPEPIEPSDWSGAPGSSPLPPPPPPPDYADWPKRALSGLIDFFGPSLVAGLIYQANDVVGYLAYLAALAWAIYNAYLGGQTGQSYGKKIAGTRLLLEATGAPPGGGLGIGRYFLHIVDGIPCYLGFLWPLWDSKRQTFADKLLKTVVVNVPTAR